VLWSEWNGVYRDTIRDFWRSNAGPGDFAARITGSADLYKDEGRQPWASINFVTAHDGFPLADLVAYEHKHNEANQEDNQDGTDDNRSWNCGAEGPTDDAGINALRLRQQLNFLATLLLSQGTPMLLGGDEMGRSQQGNNNAWCQDNELSWYDWADLSRDGTLLAFTRRLIALRKQHPVLRRERHLLGEELKGSGLPDVWWFRLDGRRMTRRDWQSGTGVVGVFLNGKEIVTPGPHGQDVEDDSFLLLFNASPEEHTFTLPNRRFGTNWMLELRTDDPAAQPGSATYGARTELTLIPHSLVVLKRAA
jgi:glycogen operon protein